MKLMDKARMRRTAVALRRSAGTVGVLSFLLWGCGGGVHRITKPALPEHIKTIHIPVFSNKTLKPDIEAEFTDLVIQEFQKDGRLKLVGPSEADAVLEGTLRHYIKEPIAYDVNNVPIQYQIRVRVSVRVIDKKDDSVVLEHKNVGGLTGGTAVFSVSPEAGFPITTETEAQREAFEKLAKDVVNRTIYGWDNV